MTIASALGRSEVTWSCASRTVPTADIKPTEMPCACSLMWFAFVLCVVQLGLFAAGQQVDTPPDPALQHKPRQLLQSGWDSKAFSTGGSNVGTTLPLATSVGGQTPFSSSFGQGFQQFFSSGNGAIPSSTMGGSSSAGSQDRQLPMQSLARRTAPDPSTDYSWPGDEASSTLVDQTKFNARDNPYIAQYQTQQGMRLAAQAVAEQQQQYRQSGSSMSDQSRRVANMAYHYRLATKGMAALGPIVTPQMAAALGGGDDDPEQLSEPLFRAPSGKAASGARSSAPAAAGQPPKAKSSSRSGPAQGYLDSYDYEIQPTSFTTSAGTSTSRSMHNLALLQYIQNNSPFAAMADPASPDLPNLADLVDELRNRMQQDKAAGQKHGLGQRSANLLQQLLRVGYGDAAGAVDSSAQASAEGLGDVVGSPAGRGYGHGDYYEEDYEDSHQPTGVPQSMMRSGVPYGHDGLGGGQPGFTGAGGRRNLSVGEIAPFCQPPILLCADRDLLNILGTEIDQVRFPDNVLEYASLRRRLERVVDNLLDTNFSPLGGPTIDFNQVLSLNFRLRTTLALFNGLNGIGSNRLALNTLSWDASRPDRLLPESFAWDTAGVTSDNSFNRVQYVPTYIITGTGPGFASTAIAFGPFVDFQVADFRS